MLKVSIIVPVYNVEQYLRECLDSLVNQTYKNIEIICIDDGSTDSSGQILDEYDKQYDSIRVIHKSNRGLSSARNYGIRAAKGDLIAFVDSDDYIELDTIESAVKTFELNDKQDLYIYGIEMFTNDEVNENIESTNAWFSRRLSKKQNLIKMTFDIACDSNIHVCNKVFRKSLMHDLEFIEGLLYEDIYFMWMCFFRCRYAYYNKSIQYHYRIHSNSIMQKTSNNKKLETALHHLKNWEHLFIEFSKEHKVKLYKDDLIKLLSRLSETTRRMSPEDCKYIIDSYYAMYYGRVLKEVRNEECDDISTVSI